MKTLKALKFIGFTILWICGITLIIFITMSLWNWLIPLLFNGPIITFWLTAGLFLLSKILLAGFAPGGGRPRRRISFENFGEGEHRPSREDWLKRFYEMKKVRDSSSPVK